MAEWCYDSEFPASKAADSVQRRSNEKNFTKTTENLTKEFARAEDFFFNQKSVSKAADVAVDLEALQDCNDLSECDLNEIQIDDKKFNSECYEIEYTSQSYNENDYTVGINNIDKKITPSLLEESKNIAKGMNLCAYNSDEEPEENNVNKTNNKTQDKNYVKDSFKKANYKKNIYSNNSQNNSSFTDKPKFKNDSYGTKAKNWQKIPSYQKITNKSIPEQNFNMPKTSQLSRKSEQTTNPCSNKQEKSGLKKLNYNKKIMNGSLSKNQSKSIDISKKNQQKNPHFGHQTVKKQTNEQCKISNNSNSDPFEKELEKLNINASEYNP
ncbi:MAG: hypothetical protein MHPSP_000631, partial [Paramarteilia canceri]